LTNLDDILADYFTGDKAMVQFDREEDTPSMGEVAVVVEGDGQQALVDIGWDDQGVTVDVRVFEDREQTTAAVSEFFGTTQIRVDNNKEA
jgi:hypothetical protein